MNRNDEKNYEFIPNVWLSTDTQLHNNWRFVNFVDKGGLTLSREGLCFSGRRDLLTISDMLEIDLIYANFPWGNLLIVFVIILVYVFGSFYVGASPGTAIPFDFFIGLVLAIMLVSALEKTRLWIKITYRDEKQNTPQVICLSDGSRLNVGELRGGTLSLYKKIRALYLQKAN